MIKIKISDQVPLGVQVEAVCFHLTRGEDKARPVRVYTVLDDGQAVGRYVLTRYRAGEAVDGVQPGYSSLLRVNPSVRLAADSSPTKGSIGATDGDQAKKSVPPKVSKGRPESPFAAPAGEESPAMHALSEYARADRRDESRMMMDFWTEMGAVLE